MHGADALWALTRWQHFSALNDVMASILRLLHHIQNPTQNLTQSIDVYMYLLAKFHPNPIWNDDRALGVFEDGRPNNKNQVSSDMRSVPDLKIDHSV